MNDNTEKAIEYLNSKQALSQYRQEMGAYERIAGMLYAFGAMRRMTKVKGKIKRQILHLEDYARRTTIAIKARSIVNYDRTLNGEEK